MADIWTLRLSDDMGRTLEATYPNITPSDFVLGAVICYKSGVDGAVMNWTIESVAIDVEQKIIFCKAEGDVWLTTTPGNLPFSASA